MRDETQRDVTDRKKNEIILKFLRANRLRATPQKISNRKRSYIQKQGTKSQDSKNLQFLWSLLRGIPFTYNPK